MEIGDFVKLKFQFSTNFHIGVDYLFSMKDCPIIISQLGLLGYEKLKPYSGVINHLLLPDIIYRIQGKPLLKIRQNPLYIQKL